ncbi:MAG: Gfo/Idh/MocA family protein [Dehalococcoidia bacterium]
MDNIRSVDYENGTGQEDAVVQTVRIGVIGAGANTRLRHIPNLQSIEGVRVAVVCNRSEESGRRVAEAFGIERVTVDPEDVFTSPDIDAVCIGTWPYRHREFTVRALAAGKHVLCEARMAMDGREAREMLAASRARPELVAQLVPAPFDLRSWRTVRRVLADGVLGALREVQVTSLNGNAFDLDAPLHWRERREYSGMNAMNLGILAETVERWLGPTVTVVSDASTGIAERVDEESGARTRIEVPDGVAVLARMASGVRVTYRVSTVVHSPRDGGGISIFGSRGTLHWSLDDTMVLAMAGEEARTLPPDAGSAGSWRVERDFVDSIREGAPVELTDFEAGLRYMQFTEAVWRSWTERRLVEVASL